MADAERLEEPKGADGRDQPGPVAASCRLALEATTEGSQAFIIAGADTVVNHPSAELLAEVFPDVPLNLSSTLCWPTTAPREAAGFEPPHSWPDHVNPPATR